MDQSAREARPHPKPSTPQPDAGGGRGGAVLLVLAGLAAATLSGLLAVAGEVHPSGDWIALRLARLGVQPGLLGLCAVTLLGAAFVLGGVARVRRRVSESGRRGEELCEKVGGQVVALRRSLHDFRAEVVWLREAMTGLSEVVRDHLAQSQGAQNAAAHKDDAVFRVAASLDQLGARVEGRLQRTEAGQSEGLTRLESRLAGLGQQLEQTLGGLMGELANLSTGQGRYELDSRQPYDGTPSRPSIDYGDAFEEPYQGSESDLHVEVSLEELEPRRTEASKEQEPQQAELDGMDPALFETSLGLLDAFDEYGDFKPEKAAQQEEPPAPLPGDPQGKQGTPGAAREGARTGASPPKAPGPGTPPTGQLRLSPRPHGQA